MNTKELAKKNYPRCWTAEMVEVLVAKGKLTSADYEEITGEVYTGTMGLGEYKAFYEAAKEILPEGSEA